MLCSRSLLVTVVETFSIPIQRLSAITVTHSRSSYDLDLCHLNINIFIVPDMSTLQPTANQLPTVRSNEDQLRVAHGEEYCRPLPYKFHFKAVLWHILSHFVRCDNIYKQKL